MPSQTNEQALEAAIEKALSGSSREERGTADAADPAQPYRSGKGYWVGNPSDFNLDLALDELRFWDFLERTQKEEVDKLRKDPQYKLKVMQRLDRLIQKNGVLHVLRNGLAVEDAHFTLFYNAPLASSSAAVRERFEQNQFSVTRQVRYNRNKPSQEIDMVVFLNGLPLATIELKNAWTHQTARIHGIKQYKQDRDQTQPLLQFGRCVVHFAVDTEEVWMCTRLNGINSVFLPFNKGHNGGAGNPPPAEGFGHRTIYLWEEILARESLANILQHFVRLDGKPNSPLEKRTLYFPRYHQLQVVRKLMAHASTFGVGQTYLVQHSAGSGKSNSITWAAYQLIECYPSREGVPGSKGLEAPLFDTVIVVTDRRLLDKQIRRNVKQFSVVKNIVAAATTSAELKAALEGGKRIIITTIQKFPVIVDGIADLKERRFAVLIDEAHSSQSGVASDKMNEAMGGRGEGEEDEDVVLTAMARRKMRDNASYVAFTATPKPATLEKFGTKQADGTYKPFDLYSMKQAIEEGFILDVLANYTSYKSYYELQKSIADNPLFQTAKAQKKLHAHVQGNEITIKVKAEVMVQHFIDHVVKKKRLKGQGKAMVVTQNIEQAITYFMAIRDLLEQMGAGFKAAVAFSGTKRYKGVEWTEDTLNNFPPEKDKGLLEDDDYIEDTIARHFDKDEYRILVVADKFLTGFDQPKLCTMYVDKKLQDVKAVQTLSRLNRSAPKLDKKSEFLFVLDFTDQAEEIKKAFDKYYTTTTLSGATDVNVLHDLKNSLDLVGVYEQAEVEQFTEDYLKGVDAQLLAPLIQTGSDRFKEGLGLTDQEKADFKVKAKQFVKIYAQLASILPYSIADWELLYWYLKYLIPHLPVKDPEQDALDKLLESVDLSTYGLERTKLNTSIGLDASDTELDPQNPAVRGAHGGGEEKEELEKIIKAFNERWFKGWDATPEEQRVKCETFFDSVQSTAQFKEKIADNPDRDNMMLALTKAMNEALNKDRRNNMEFYKMFVQDEGFRTGLMELFLRTRLGKGDISPGA